jgi:O-succinylbenzoic acid--CoA ligase
MARTVELLEVPNGLALLDLLPRLTDALAGVGPALAPVAAGDRAQIELLTEAFGIGLPLAEGEDDPADPTVIVIATSGSTGTPKGTLLTRSALAASAAATQARLGPPGCWLLALPAQHIAGLQVLLRSLAAGTDPYLMDTGEPFTPARFVRAAAGLPVGPRYLSLVPTQLHRILGDEEGTSVLRTFDAVLVGGSATPTTLLTSARRAGVRIVTSYGMSETCGGCVYDGVPLDGVTAELDDTGRVQLSGPMIGRGYRSLPGHPAFPEPLDRTGRPDQPDRTFLTDDLGEWVGGRLRILGRIDDVIITGGLKIAPTAVEDAIATLASVAQVVIVGLPDAEWGRRLVAVVVAAEPHRPPTLPEIQLATAAAGIAVNPRDLVIVPEIPSRGPGKPDRAAALTLATPAAGRLFTVARTPPLPT